VLVNYYKELILLRYYLFHFFYGWTLLSLQLSTTGSGPRAKAVGVIEEFNKKRFNFIAKTLDLGENPLFLMKPLCGYHMKNEISCFHESRMVMNL
jgi:hypothetical protein